MAKNPNNKPAVVGRRRKSPCCTCLMIMLIVSLLLIVILIGGAWFVGDHFSRQYLGLGLTDVFGAISDVRNVDEKKLDIQTYNDDDLKGFENAFKRQLYLKDTVELPYEEIFTELLNASGASGDEAANPDETASRIPEIRNTPLMAAIREYGPVADADEAAINADWVLELAAKIVQRDNLDLDRFNEFTGEVEKLTFTDKQVAAFLNKVLHEGLKRLDLHEAIGAAEAEIKQLRFSGTAEAPAVRITVSANTQNIMNTLLNGEDIQQMLSVLPDFAVGMAKGVLNWMVPKKIFVTADITLGENPSLALYINNTDDKKMVRLYTLIENGAKNIAEQSINVPEMLDEAAQNTLKPVADALSEYADFGEIGQGKLSADILGTVINLSNINQGKEDADKVVPADLIYALKFLFTSVPEGITVSPAADYDLFMAEIQSKFYLSDTPEDFNDLLSVADVNDFDFTKFNLNGSAEGQPKERSLAYDTRSAEELKLFLSDAELAVIAKEQIGKNSTLLDQGQMMNLVALTTRPKNPGAPDASGIVSTADGTLLLLLEIDLDGIMNSAGVDFLDTLLPEAIRLSLRFDITDDNVKTLEGENGYSYYGAEFALNGRGKNSAEFISLSRLIRTASGIGGGEIWFDADEIGRIAGRSIYDIMTLLRENVGAENIRFASRSVADNTETGLRFNSFYHFLAQSKPDANLDAELLLKALRGMYEFDADLADENAAYAGGHDNFVAYGNPGEAVVWHPLADELPALPPLESPLITVPETTVYDNGFGTLLASGTLSVLYDGVPITIPLFGTGTNPFANDDKYSLVQFNSVSTGADTARLTLTYEVMIDATDYTDADGDSLSGFDGLMPEKMYFTFLLDWDKHGDTPYVLVEQDGRDFIINQLTPEEQLQLFGLFDYDRSLIQDKMELCLSAFDRVIIPLVYRDGAVVLESFDLLPFLFP